MKAKLVLISPDADAKEFKIALPIKIGRGQEAKLKLVHPLVSRVHCEIYEQGDQLMVRDLASLNGTFVDDERVADEMALPSGCRLTVGSANFHVLYGADYDRPLPARPAAKSDTPTVRPDETVPLLTVAPASTGDDAEDDPWTMSESKSEAEEPDENTRTLDFDFLGDDEVPKPAAAAKPAAAPAKAAAKPAAKPAAPAKPAAAAAKPAAKPGAAAKPAAPVRPPNPAEFADDEETANSARPFAAQGRPPAKTAPAAQAPPAPADDSEELAVGPAEESAGGGDNDDLDDFLKSIM